MSYDPNAGMPPMGNMEQRPSSGKKWWMLGGCGCLTFLLLCCGGGGGMFYSFVQPVMQEINQTMSLVRDSDAVANALGTPIELSEAPAKQASGAGPDGMPLVDCEYSIKGSVNEGVLKFKLQMNPDWSWETTDLHVELEDGTRVDVNPDESIPDLDIDVGDIGGVEEDGDLE